MRRPDHNTTSLPRRLREELAVPESTKSDRRHQTLPGIRKERRKAARIEKKAKKGPIRLSVSEEQRSRTSSSRDLTKGVHKSAQATEVPLKTKVLPSKPKQKAVRLQRTSSARETDEESSPSPPPAPRNVSRGVKERIAKDDAEIAALEGALGIKGRKTLPKSFTDDGLDILLGGLGDELNEGEVLGKRKRDEGEEWLATKRRKVRRMHGDAGSSGIGASGSSEEHDGSFGGLSDEESQSENNASSADGEGDDGSLSEGFGESSSPAKSPTKRTRENPYIAPTSSTIAAPKYIPPSLRNQTSAETEDLSRLRRKIQGLINRLSEANLISTLGDLESLYRSDARQHVSLTLIDLLLNLLCDPAILQDTFVILHAGILTALHKTIGSDFGAQIVQRIDEEFRTFNGMDCDNVPKGKKLTNLISLMSYLYTFQMIGSNLIYDYIKLFAKDLSEEATELLLKCMRICGPQLRHDDPSALKEIILLVQNSISKIGESNLSVRTKFMIETINNLKNNRTKTGIAGSEVILEHVVRVKKTLGSLNSRNIKTSEPLRIGLRDIRESDKRGKWWLIGASYKDVDGDAQDEVVGFHHDGLQGDSESNPLEGATEKDLLQLAREQRMNTDIRRSIFVTIMSATDYDDAFHRLMKLRLKKAQELEIPKVIVHCAGAEESYNPYYTLVARRLCADRKLKWAFQFSLWSLFRRMGEGTDDDQNETEEEDENLGMRSLVNLAKMFGTLVAEGALSMKVFQTLNFPYMQPKTCIFVELMIISIILRSQKGIDGSRDEESVMRIFISANSKPEMAKGLQYFLRKNVSRTDIAGTDADKKVVRWGCKIARDALEAAASSHANGD